MILGTKDIGSLIGHFDPPEVNGSSVYFHIQLKGNARHYIKWIHNRKRESSREIRDYKSQ